MKSFFIQTLSLFILYSCTIYCQGNLSEANRLFKERKYAESRAILQKILDKNKNEAEAFYLLSKIYYHENNIDEAEEYAENAVDINENNAEFHYWLGVCYGRDSQNASIFRRPFLASKTKNEFLKAIRLNPNHIEAHSGLGQFYLIAPGIMGGDVDKAIEQAKILVKLDEIKGRLLFIQIYNDQDKTEKVADEYKALEKIIGNNQKYFSFYNSYGYFLLNQGKVDEAIGKFRKQVEIAPGNANAHDSLGEGLLKKRLLKESLAEYNRALQIDPDLENSKDKVREIKKLIAEKEASDSSE